MFYYSIIESHTLEIKARKALVCLCVVFCFYFPLLFFNRYGEVQHDKGQTALARTCLQLACEIGKHYFGFQESYSLRKRLAELSEGEEAEKLQNEADKMKELCSVERANVEQLGHMRVKRQKNSYVDKLKAILSRKVWFTLYQMLLLLLVITILMVAYILLYRW